MERVTAGASAPELLLRRGLLLLTATAALTGILAGLSRLGVELAWGPAHAARHGPLLILGAFGTVIALERAVALGHGLAMIAPGLGGAAAVGILAGAPWAPWVAVAAAVGLVVLNLLVVRKQPVTFTMLMVLGSVLLLLGSTSWALGQPVAQVVPTWVGFFVLTIVAERLELCRLAPTPSWAIGALVVTVSLLAFISVACLRGGELSSRMLGLGLAFVALWQLRFDLAHRTLRRPGLPRFAAIGVLLGAAWLLVAGVLVAGGGLPSAGPLRDAALHAVFVGYVLSMVFAHAPMVLPAVARVSVPFSSLFHLPLALLHLGLASRVVGDLVGQPVLRRVGGVGSAVALAVFVVAVVTLRVRERPRPQTTTR